jgi:aspartate oxidase
VTMIKRHVVTVTTDASGDAIAYSPVLTGKISTIRYVKTDFADGVDITVTAEATGEGIWAEENVNASATRAPRQLVYTTAGVASLYAATFGVYTEPIVLSADRVKIVVAQGGDTKSGTFHIVTE